MKSFNHVNSAKYYFMFAVLFTILTNCNDSDSDFKDTQNKNNNSQSESGKNNLSHSGDIVKEQGFAYMLYVPKYYNISDDMDNPKRSKLILYEDGKPLGPAHSMHNDIREKGHGRYSHWHQVVVFSTSDNSDPIKNGRIYTVEIK